MPFETPKVPAFKEDLKRSQFDRKFGPETNRIWEFQNTDQYIIRKSLDRRDQDAFDPGKEAEISKRLFDELRDKYHIDAPLHFVVAHDEALKDDKADVFILTEKVRESEQALTQEDKNRANQEYAELWRGLATYYEDKYTSRARFLTDLADENQYKYGKIEGDTEPHWYLIDTDPFHSQTVFRLYEAVEGLLDIATDAQETHNLDLSDIKKRCRALMRKMKQEVKSELYDDDSPVDEAIKLYANPGI